VKAGRGAKWAAKWAANLAAKWTGLAAALLLLAFDASAQGQPGSSPDRGNGAGPQRMGQGPHRQQRARGEGPGPQGMAPTTGPAQLAAGDGAAPRGGQMSREERRQLRRDVHEAGRDLYPERRHGRGPEQSQPPPARPTPAQ
jgi:hypothetical protein